MPKTTDAPKLDELRHEFYCLPQDGAEAPRVEGFPVYVDDENGRSKAASFCTRCIECGAESYRPLT